MVVDSSAVVAFLRGEPEAEAIEALLEASPLISMSAFTQFECRTVLHARFGLQAAVDFELLAAKLGIAIVPFDTGQAELAFGAYKRFGKGSSHRAQLNLGDCVSYALAMHLGQPLLFVGHDFTHTDVELALKARNL